MLLKFSYDRIDRDLERRFHRIAGGSYVPGFGKPGFTQLVRWFPTRAAAEKAEQRLRTAISEPFEIAIEGIEELDA